MGVDSNDLIQLDKNFERILNEFPQRRRELHQDAAEMLEQVSGEAIQRSGFTGGEVRRWQIKKTGSGGGYARIKAAGLKDPVQTKIVGRKNPWLVNMPQSGENSPGAITNYLQNGHKTRRPGSGKNYKPRIKRPKTAGRPFYDTAAVTAEANFIRMANAFADRLVAELGGG